MPAYPRRDIVAHDEVGVYHCIARCVRRAFLCGVDPLSGVDHEHRKEWIRERLQQLASVFAIDVCGYAVMSNHLHVVLRGRPDLAQDWSDEEVAIRWKRLYPARDPATGSPIEPAECDLAMIVSDRARVSELRERLSSLSWFMRCLSEPIARRANREDGCTGRFWEGRFKSQALLDEAAILACSIYVDLNPIRAGIATRPEESEHTSAFDRIQSIQAAVAELEPSDLSESVGSQESEHQLTSRVHPSPQRSADEWLCELTLLEGPAIGPDENEVSADAGRNPTDSTPEVTAEAGRRRSRVDRVARASDQGYLPMTLEKYLSLLDWTGRQLGSAAGGMIPAELGPILERLGIKSACWVETVQHFGRWFKRAVGRRDSLAALALRARRSWFQGQRAAAVAFS